MLGILDDVNRRCGSAFREEGDVIVLLRADSDETGGVGGSEYLALIHNIEAGRPPSINLDDEKRLQACLLEAIGQGLLGRKKGQTVDIKVPRGTVRFKILEISAAKDV